jgi:hypothetical protein
MESLDPGDWYQQGKSIGKHKKQLTKIYLNVYTVQQFAMTIEEGIHKNG